MEGELLSKIQQVSSCQEKEATHIKDEEASKEVSDLKLEVKELKEALRNMMETSVRLTVVAPSVNVHIADKSYKFHST